MARFRPLYIRRSDGKAETIGRGKKREPNQPTDDQLDQKPDKDGVSDFYREVALDGTKHLDWRRKLGGMLARELDWKDNPGSDHGYMLVAFPENYHLYEHVKKTEKDGKLEVKNKTHAAGGNDRQDAYLYGHPDGRRKRFRSPADFFPHLLWLATDESGDPDNCSCKLCSPEDLENIVPAVKTKADKATKTEMVVKQVMPVSQTGDSAASRQALKPLDSSNKPEPPKAIPRQNSGSRANTPSPLPPKRNRDQNFDSLFRLFVYRPGELVWFARGQAWGLGVIIRRWQTPDRLPKYQVQALSHPGHYPESLLKSEPELRPWLAWSVPRYIAPGLNDLPNPVRYESADWKGMSELRFGPGDMEVDASILAAKMIDGTYSPFQLESSAEIQPGIIEYRYTGVFLGAEKIWVGDPVRLVLGTGSDIMVVHAITERRNVNQASSATPNDSINKPTLNFIGDIYTLRTVHHRDPNIPTPASPNNNPHLPQRLTEDLAYRNARSIPGRGEAKYWHLLHPLASIDALLAVKGRWYEASVMLPFLLAENEFTTLADKGLIQEASLWLNSRADCINSNRDAQLPRLPVENVRRETRKAAFGPAIPPTTEILEGFEPPAAADGVADGLGRGTGRNVANDGKSQAAPPAGSDSAGAVSSSTMEVDPAFDTAQRTEQRAVQNRSAGLGGGLDEFMNLDGMDEHAGFGQNYAGHTDMNRGSYY